MSNIDNKDLVKKSQSIFKELGVDIKTTQMYEFFAKLHGEKNWNIAKNKDLNFSEKLELTSSSFSTGIQKLDLLIGEIRRKTMTLIIGRANSGKTNLAISSGASILRETNSYGLNYNHKVLHLTVEDKNVDLKYLSILSKIKFNKILKNDLSEQEKSVVAETFSAYSNRLKVIQTIDMSSTFDDLEKKLEETYKEFPFDVLIIDGPQLLKDIYPELLTNSSFKTTVAENELYMKLHSLSHKYNCALLTSYLILPRDIDQAHIKDYMLHKFSLIRYCHTALHVDTQRTGEILIDAIKGGYFQKDKIVTLDPSWEGYGFSDK